jgi:hypothetical protein
MDRDPGDQDAVAIGGVHLVDVSVPVAVGDPGLAWSPAASERVGRPALERLHLRLWITGAEQVQQDGFARKLDRRVGRFHLLRGVGL